MTTDAHEQTDDVDAIRQVGARRALVLAVAIAATVGFVALRLFVALGGHTPLPMDEWWHALMVSTLTSVGVIVAFVPSNIGSTIGMIIIGIATCALLWWKRGRGDAVTFAAAIVLVVAIGAPMSYIIGRARPSDSLAENLATSFPSGHTAVATTFVVILGLLLRRWYIWTFGAAWVLWMMWSRTYLHAHWLSDVLAGLLEGIAVAGLVWCASEALRDRHALRERRAARAAAAPPPES